MAEAVVAYDRELPEIPGRRMWKRPASYLVKDEAAPSGWREETSGRRPSELLLTPRIRADVDAWRDGGYAGASEVTRRLFTYWFEEDHDVLDFDVPFRYYFGQREAIETLAWLVEVAGLRRCCFKLATGSGKTWVMAVVWSHFHKRRVAGSDLSTNFLIVAPNVIVYQRLEKDFADNRIFHQLPRSIPGARRWARWSPAPTLRVCGDVVQVARDRGRRPR